jgi:hypothetical protein
VEGRKDVTTQTCTFGTIAQFSNTSGTNPNINSGNVGFVQDANGNDPGSSTDVNWSSLTASLFNGTSGSGASCGSIKNKDTAILLATNPTWSGGGIPVGATISDISITIGRVQATGTASADYVYDWLLYLIHYNGTDLSSGALSSSNLAVGPPNYNANQWPNVTSAPTSTANFTTESYDAGTPSGATVSVLNSSTFGVVFAATGPTATSTAYVNEISVTVTYTASSPPAFPAPLLPPGAMGLGASPAGGMTNQQRRNRIEGIRYVYNRLRALIFARWRQRVSGQCPVVSGS